MQQLTRISTYGTSLLLGAALLGACAERAACPVREADRAVVDRALDAYGKGKVSREVLWRSFDIAVVYLPSMTCVGFNLKPGTAGGDETMCFNAKGETVLTYSDGD